MLGFFRFMIQAAVILVLAAPVSCKRSEAPASSDKGKSGEVQANQSAAVEGAKKTSVPRFAKKGPRVGLIGIDSADWDTADPLIQDGKLPTLGFLKENGAWGRLKSISPMHSPALWTTIATGKTFAKHGILDSVVHGEDGRDVPVTNNFRKVKALWNILSERDISVGFINWWPSFPAEKVNGFIISNYTRYYYPHIMAHKGDMAKMLEETKSLKRITYPEELRSLFMKTKLPESRFLKSLDLKKIKSHRMTRVFDKPLNVTYKDAFEVFSYVARGDELFCILALELLADKAPDLFGIYLEGLDTANHLFWRYAHPDQHVVPEKARDLGGIIDAYHQFTDGLVADLLSRFSPETNIITVSDHGYGDTGTGHFHHEHGIIILTGPAFKKGVEVKQASILDVTPTILYLLDLPVAKDMDGKVLFSAFTDEFRKAHAPKWVDSYEEAGSPKGSPKAIVTPLDNQMLEKLRTLGYLE